MSESDKRLAVPGPRGQQGEQGEQGKRGHQGEQGAAGLSRTVRRALVFLFVLSVLLAGFDFIWSARQQNAYEANLTREHVAHLKQDALLIGKLCLTFGKLGALMPPPGNPETNPSRAYEDRLHVTLIELGADLGCKST